MSDVKTVLNGTKGVIVLILPSDLRLTFLPGESKNLNPENFKAFEKSILAVAAGDKDFRVIKQAAQEALKKSVEVASSEPEVLLSPIDQAAKELKEAEEFQTTLPAKARKTTIDSAAQRVEEARDKYLQLLEAETAPVAPVEVEEPVVSPAQ